ncbi:MAG: KamA family radical SAM protein [Blautia sp.]|jgi:lysine 2,3-aminomutase
MDWRKELRQNVTKASELRERLGLSKGQEDRLARILEHFPMTVTRYYLSLVDWGNYKEDPIFKMCIPSIEETDLTGRFDTSGEGENTVMPGMQHKYAQTVLILSTHRCAMYCRHCFRKRLVGISEDETAENVEDMAAYVAAHKEVNNVLISGGDAFLNSNEVIRRYLELFSGIAHLDLIRFGTRTLVVFPDRITEDPELVSLLKEYNKKKQIYVVTQFNHPKELTEEAVKAVHILRDAGIVVKNQTVLLKGVNDDGQVLGELLKGLTRAGVIPYYIFQCRPVSGVQHQFQVPIFEGVKVVEEAKNMQNGQGKCIRYAMSHETGKIEILGLLDNGDMLFKYHQAKYKKDQGRIFRKKLRTGQAWLEDNFGK